MEKKKWREQSKGSLKRISVQMSLKWNHGHKSGIKNGHQVNGCCMLGPESAGEDQQVAWCASRTLILQSLSGEGRRNRIFHSCYCGGGNLLLLFLRVIKYSVSAPLLVDTLFLLSPPHALKDLPFFHWPQQNLTLLLRDTNLFQMDGTVTFDQRNERDTGDSVKL